MLEIKKLVGEMMAARIIRETESPFSTLVLIVKKNDGSWCFCVDYRVLNKATVPDCVPIQAIDELLNERIQHATFRSWIGSPDITKFG